MLPSSVESMIEPSSLLDLFLYDADSGLLYWKKSMKLAGTKRKDGRMQVQVFGRVFLSHRIVWAIHHGSWPSFFVDHIDMDKMNNKISNLREATKEENSRNTKKKKTNTSGLKGVSFHRLSGKWRADINLGMKQVSLGLFCSKEDAYAAYCKASKDYHGDFSNLDQE